MILVKLDEELSRLEEERDRIAETLQELSETLNAMKAQLAEGDGMNRTEAGKILSDVRYWARASHETEAQIANVRRKQMGLDGDWALDLETARTEIGCRLDRLRACCCEGAVSEGP